MKTTNIQRTYKDSLFRMIFREKKELLSLYNALNDSDYQNPEELTINTVENIIYMGMKNDVSFLIEEYLNLYEAQSTWNPNMPLRDVFYLAELYKGYVEENNLDIYGSAQLRLPIPRCIVFYNGVKKMEDIRQVRLSESYGDLHGQEPALECVVTYLNVNYGHNQKLMEQCRKLGEYAFLINQIREQLKTGKQLQAAVHFAVSHCIEHGILEEFLRKHRAEVTDVILTEYDQERHIKNEKQLSYREGHEDGRREGQREGYSAGEREGSIKTSIRIYRSLGWSDADICKTLKKEYQISEEEVEILMETKE